MIRVAVKNVYGDEMKPETSTVPELLESGLCLQASLAQAGFEMRPFIDWAGALPDVAVFFDCPRMDDPDLRRCLAQATPFLLVISENLHLQTHPTYRKLKPLARKILTYDLDEIDGQKVFWLPYSLDMGAGRRNRESALKQARPHLLGMVNSWKKGNAGESLWEKKPIGHPGWENFERGDISCRLGLGSPSSSLAKVAAELGKKMPVPRAESFSMAKLGLPGSFGAGESKTAGSGHL
jgi:hypothetical protein